MPSYSALTCAALAPVAIAGAAPPDAARSMSAATIRPCGPEPEMRVRSMPRSPARRRASGVTAAPVASLAGPKFRSGVRTAWNGSIGAAGRGIGVEWTADADPVVLSSPRKRGPGAASPWTPAGACTRAALGADPGAGVSGGWLAGCDFVASPAPEITATTAPTLATSPTWKRISVRVPLVVDGTSIDVLSVSISKRLSPGFTASPAFLNHLVILPSATVSPSCGIRTSTVLPSNFCRLPLPAHRHILRLEEFHHPLVRPFAAKPGLLRAAERRRRIRNQAAVEADHSEIEFLRHPHAATEVLCIEISNQAVFRIVGPLDRLLFGLEGLD